MKKAFTIFLTFFIPAVSVFLFWAIATNNIFITLGIGVPDSIVVGILFMLLDFYFIRNRILKYKFCLRFCLLIILFILITIVHLLIEKGEIIEPLKNLF